MGLTGAMEPFTYNALPGCVIFGPGTLDRLPDEIERLGLAHGPAPATPRQAAHATQLDAGRAIALRTDLSLGGRPAGARNSTIKATRHESRARTGE